MELDQTLCSNLLGSTLMLRSYALSLCGTIDRAEDLVQETLLRAIAHVESFQPGTNLSAWLITILRNYFFSQRRKQRREVEDVDDHYADRGKREPEQIARVDFADFRTAFSKLPSEQRQALMLVGASGLSYSEAASQCGCPAGTIKSRVHRARARLVDLLAIDISGDFGADGLTRAVVDQGSNSSMEA